ncbi:carbon storage regulator CsrA [Fictibacillus phosphorivorans]|uniref:carbon storage regulator CsrA n=1 Tax=Fictibacillus phosphorivorans TaxID=1221500 RepID=UPI0011AAF806|nr:carbon storage regulator CsrA [Fictibacillus phosphorivorans]
MLVLTRKLQEAIKIGEDIELTVLSIDGEQVKIGISAPKHIEIHRKEVFLSIQQENSKAASTSLNTFQTLKKLKNS